MHTRTDPILLWVLLHLIHLTVELTSPDFTLSGHRLSTANIGLSIDLLHRLIFGDALFFLASLDEVLLVEFLCKAHIATTVLHGDRVAWCLPYVVCLQ